MTEVVLFHHAQGLTAGVVAFADELRAAGHTVHTPDVYDGKTFETLTDGVAYAEEITFDSIIERGRDAVESFPTELVYIGLSLGVMPAQALAQTRPGARGAVLLHGAVPLPYFGGAWPHGVPLQIHTMDADDLGDVDVAEELVRTIDGAELFVYPGDRHLFTDSSLPVYDERAARLVVERLLEFLERVG
jgi:dienelactone hydrolase